MTDRHAQKPYPLRMPDEMRAALEISAEKVGRSLNSEICARLAASLDPESEDRLDSIGSLARRISKQVEKYGIKVRVEFLGDTARLVEHLDSKQDPATKPPRTRRAAKPK